MEENNKLSEFREIMGVKELSKYLGIGTSKIYSLIKNKKIPASKIGHQYKFSKEVIDKWLKEKIISEKPEIQLDLFSRNVEENKSRGDNGKQ